MKPLLIVDGYNVIGAWHEAAQNQWTLDESRDRLMHRLQDYAGYSGEEVVLVFDGYKSDRKARTEEKLENMTLVYTMHAETADSYIERLVAQVPKYRSVRVATSDGLEQSQVLSSGAIRVTSRELLRELQKTRQTHRDELRKQPISSGNRIGLLLPRDIADAIEKMRYGDKTDKGR